MMTLLQTLAMGMFIMGATGASYIFMNPEKNRRLW
jgi:hypothetical protein